MAKIPSTHEAHLFISKPAGEAHFKLSVFTGQSKMMRAFRDLETLIQFMNGHLIYYNFFKPNETLKGKTPAEAAKVNYRVKHWKDLCHLPVSKQAEIESDKRFSVSRPPRITEAPHR